MDPSPPTEMHFYNHLWKYSSGFYKLGSGLKVEYKASSTWQNGLFGHEPHDAVQTRESYWSSGHKATEPVYWWMSFGEEQVEIVAVDFFLFYPGGKYEFFATADKEKCFSKKDADDDRRFFFEHSFSGNYYSTKKKPHPILSRWMRKKIIWIFFCWSYFKDFYIFLHSRPMLDLYLKQFRS